MACSTTPGVVDPILVPLPNTYAVTGHHPTSGGAFSSADDTDCGERADLEHLLELWNLLPTWRHPDCWMELAATGCAIGQDCLLEKA
jgi:hypothetical protein